EALKMREIELCLVDARLFEGVSTGRKDRHDPLGDLRVELAIAVDEDDLGRTLAAGGLGQLPGPRDGHGRADAVAPGGVAGGLHDAAAVALLGVGANHDGLVTQGGVVARLDRRVVGVHVHMRDDPHVATTLAEGARAGQYAAGHRSGPAARLVELVLLHSLEGLAPLLSRLSRLALLLDRRLLV